MTYCHQRPTTDTPPSMTYWACSMAYCHQRPTTSNRHTAQYELLGLQYDLLPPTNPPPGMTYRDCSMTYCHQQTQYGQPQRPAWPEHSNHIMTELDRHALPRLTNCVAPPAQPVAAPAPFKGSNMHPYAGRHLKLGSPSWRPLNVTRLPYQTGLTSGTQLVTRHDCIIVLFRLTSLIRARLLADLAH